MICRPDHRVFACAALATVLVAATGCAGQPQPAGAVPPPVTTLHQAYTATLASGSAAVRMSQTVYRSGRSAGTITGTGHVDFRRGSSDLVFATAQFAGIEVLRLGDARYRRKVRAGQAPSADWQRLSSTPSAAVPQQLATGDEYVTKTLGYLGNVGADAHVLGPDPQAGSGSRYHVDLATATGKIGIDAVLDGAGRLSHEQVDATDDPPGTTMTLTIDLTGLGAAVTFPRPAA